MVPEPLRTLHCKTCESLRFQSFYLWLILQDHMSLQCPHATTHCDLGCGKAFPRSLKNQHSGECRKKAVACSYNAMVTKDEVEEHRSVCQDVHGYNWHFFGKVGKVGKGTQDVSHCSVEVIEIEQLDAKLEVHTQCSYLAN